MPSDRGLGFYGKFLVERLDGSSKPGEKHAECSYFVLDLMHDKFARAALRAYAEVCAEEYPLLAIDLERIADNAERVESPDAD